MKLKTLCLSLALVTATLNITPLYANPVPPTPEGGLIVLHKDDCVDIATQEEGICVVAMDKEDNIYVIFFQHDKMMFIRRIVGDGYEELWTNDKFNSF